MKQPLASAMTMAVMLTVLTAGCAGSNPPDPPEVQPPEADPVFSTTLSITVDTSLPQSISPYFYGHNYWNWVRQWGGAALEGTRDQAVNLGIQLLRAGGINNDNNNYEVEHLSQPEPFDDAQLDAFVAYARAIGAQPLLQLPVLKAPNGEFATPATAVEMIRYANRTQNYELSVFSIGNEPDMYVESGDRLAEFDAEQACATFASYAQAVRAEVPDAIILGPDLAWKYQSGANDWLSPFLAHCAEQVDVVTVHRYPFESQLATDTAAFSDVANFRSTLARIRAKMAANGAGDKPLAMTEANVGYSAAAEKNTASPGTYAAALWTADIMGAALEEGLWNLSFWHLSDSADQRDWALGFYHGGKPRPAAHAYKMVSEALRTHMFAVTGATSGVSVYAGSNGEGSTLIAINKSAEMVRLEINGLSADTAVLDLAPRSIASSAVSTTGALDTVFFEEGMTEPVRRF